MFIFGHVDFEISFKPSNTDVKESFNGLFRSSGKRGELEIYNVTVFGMGVESFNQKIYTEYLL